MSDPLAVHDLIANDDEASPIHDLPYFGPITDLQCFDQLEYCMGMNRGGLQREIPGESTLKVRQNLIDAFFDGLWILLPEDKIIKMLMSVIDRGQRWGSVPGLMATTYNYRLFYLEDKLTIKDALDRSCIPGTTVLNSTMHPCLTLFAAHRFFLGLPGLGRQRTGFHLRQKKEWQTVALAIWASVANINKTCTLSFFETDRSLDAVRPAPRYYLDDSADALENGGVVTRRWGVDPEEEEGE